MKKTLMIIGGGTLGITILITSLIAITSLTSYKLKCDSQEGNITIMYNKKTLTGYTAIGMTYDMEQQRRYAEKISTEKYVKEFSEWFKTNTTGTCTIED